MFDISSPSAPTGVGFYDTPGEAYDVALVGGYVYIADESSGLRVVDVSSPSAPTEVGFYDTPGEALDVTVAPAGDYAYVAVGVDGLRVVDIFTPSSPSEVGYYDTPGHARGVAVAPAGNYVYVADRDGLCVVDISTPSSPSEVGYYDTPGYANDVAVAPAGDYAYVADESSGLRVVDVSIPSAPTEVGYCDTSGLARDVSVAPAGDYAYVAHYYGDLRIVDISTPSSPSEVGYYDMPGFARGVAVAPTGDYAYVADSNGGLRVVDVSTPSSPIEVGSYDTPGFARGVAVAPAGDYAYVADSLDGLWVVDVSTPSAPTEVGYYDTLGVAQNVAVAPAGDYIYVADYSGGLVILRYVTSPEAPVLSTISNPDGNGNYTVDWSNVTGVSSYTLEEDNNADFTSPTTRYSGSDSQYAVSGQATGIWYYRVKASNAAGDSDWSNTESTSVQPSCDYPLTGVSIGGPSSGETGNDLTFTANPQPSNATTPITYTWSSDGLVSGQGANQASYRWTSAGNKSVQVTARNCGGQDLTDSQPVAISAPLEGDAYEPDDTCVEASSIPTDGTVQEHTFHDQADDDWISFEATQGITYVIQASAPAGSDADVAMEIYGDCGDVIQPGKDPSFAADVRLVLEFPEDGTYHLHLFNHDPTVYGEKVNYRLSVRALGEAHEPGVLVLVAGRYYPEGDSRDLQENIRNVANQVYSVFRAKDYPQDRIYYLATDTDIPDVVGFANKTNLEYAITQWTLDKELGPDRAFTLYLMDHGGYDTFYLDRPRDEWVTAQELDG